MEGLNLSNNIIRFRHERKITQEQLADFLGVTKASVSKWETKQNMPDVVLLPRMASFFDVSVDELLGYAPQLSKEQIQKIYQELCDDFAQMDFETAMQKSRKLVREYYSCYPFLSQIVVLWMNHFMISPKDGGRDVLEEAIALCDHISENCKDIGICNDVIQLKASLFLQLGRAQEVIELLEDLYDPRRISRGGEAILVQAYQMTGGKEKADSYNQIFMYLQILSLVGSATHHMTIHGDDLSICEETFQRIQQIIQVYELKDLNFNIVVLANYQMAIIYCTHGQHQKALPLLKELVELTVEWLGSENSVLHGNEYFNQLDYWIEQLDLGGSAPRNKKVVYESLVGMLNSPCFTPLQEEKEFIDLKKIVAREGEKEWKN